MIEAGAGYGKSVLAVEYAEALGIASAAGVLERRDRTAASLVARLGRALRRVRLADLAAALDADGSDPRKRLARLLDALADERDAVLLVLDDAHHADSRSAADLLLELAAELPEPHRLLVLARHLPARAERLRHAPGIAPLTGEDLAFTPEEVAELYRVGFAAELADHEARRIQRATAGWPAALVTAGPRLARGPNAADVVEAIVQATPLPYLVAQSLAELDPDERAAAVQVAHLPLLSRDVVAAATGADSLFSSMLAAGLPATALRDGWWELPGPVRDFLAGVGRLDREVAARAAAVYAERDELVPAFDVLLTSGHAERAAELLESLPPHRVDALGYVDVKAVVDELPDEVVARHPRVLLALARACEPAYQAAARTAALERAAALAHDAVLRREIAAERARDLVRDGRPAEAAEVAAGVRAAAGAGELAARARALDALARARIWWGADEAALRAAGPLFEEAAAVARRLREPTWLAQALVPLAYAVHFALGDHAAAIARIGEALDALPVRTRYRGVALTFRADVEIDAGLYADAEADLAEARALARVLRDERLAAYAAWSAARMAAQRGEREALVAALDEVERHPGDWLRGSAGLEFVADAADLLSRVGEAERAQAYLERARKRQDEAPGAFRGAEAAVLARTGDPAAAAEALDRVLADPALEPRERCYALLLRAYAALRAGDPRAPELAAAAFDAAEARGNRALPLIRDHAVASRLLEALSAERPAAASDTDLPLSVSLLGEFAVMRGGVRVDLPAGQPAQAVKIAAAAGGRVHVEELIEALWPEVAPDTGRQRLRNVLARLRRSAGELLLRRGDVVAVAPGVEVDALVFDDEARRALAARPGDAEGFALARSAVARYRGELLPEDRYEPWAAAPRERLARRHLALLDLLAAHAEAQGELDEAVRLLERAIEVEPHEEDRYVHAARLLLAQGRRGRAAAMLRRAAARLDELGLAPSATLADLETGHR